MSNTGGMVVTGGTGGTGTTGGTGDGGAAPAQVVVSQQDLQYPP